MSRWSRASTLRVLPPILILVGIGLRMIGLPLVSLDMSVYLTGWYDTLAAKGFAAFREAFSNYTPPYLYLIALMTLTRGALAKVTAIKLIAMTFDMVNALLVWRILKLRFPEGATAALGAAGFLLLPTVFANSAWWGQADAVYTCFQLMCLYFLLQDRPLAAMIALGVSFSFKAQAAFLAPFILLLMLRKKIPWWYALIIPAVYGMMMVPAAVAGRPWPDLLTVYLSQADDFHALSKNAPNLYAFIPNHWYEPVVIAGLALSAALTMAWVVFYQRRIRSFSAPILLLCAFIPLALVPFLLPKMHDRYFYPADVVSYLIGFYWPSLRLAAWGYQIISGIVYIIFLSGATLEGSRVAVQAAALLNTVMVAFLLVEQYRRTSPAEEPQQSLISSGT